MASTKPLQERVVDPFASTNSDVVNRLTELVTHNAEGMLTPSCLEVVLDSTAVDTSVVVQPGYVVKDDVLIKITAEHIVDFTDSDNWVGGYTPFASGNCYVVLKYKYLKQRPAPEAEIKILSPSQRSFIDTDTSYFLLKVVSVSGGVITGLHDYDPETGYEDNSRKFIQYYAGTQVNLDSHDGDKDRGKIVYEIARNKFFFGYENDWDEITAGGVVVNLNTDSTSVVAGQLCYVDSNRNAAPAIANSLNTGADIIVKTVGTAVTGTGQAIVTGFVENVPVESGVIIYTGDLLYLSETDAGTVTNVKTEGYYQIVGRALSQGTDASPIEIIFAPKTILVTSSEGQVLTWAGPDGAGLYYHDIDISDLDGTSVFDCTLFDDATNREIQAAEIEIRNGGNTLRIYMAVNNLTLNYLIQSGSSYASSGGGGGGGSGTTDHSVLNNLDFAVAGHTGFTPSPHNNTHHSQTYITSAGVTFNNLNSNGGVGTAGTQVSFGNHTHFEYIDVPAGSDILFVEDTAQTGYTLVTTLDDAVVYMTKGSAAGGETGGTVKSGGTWSQPVHNHSITAQANHSHTTAGHTLITAEMPNHTHILLSNSMSSQYNTAKPGDRTNNTMDIQYATGSVSGHSGTTAAHSHGNTGNAGNHDHGGSTQDSSTLNTWRPYGVNVTRQQRT
jgi:hypothetical protein